MSQWAHRAYICRTVIATSILKAGSYDAQVWASLPKEHRKSVLVPCLLP